MLIPEIVSLRANLKAFIRGNSYMGKKKDKTKQTEELPLNNGQQNEDTEPVKKEEPYFREGNCWYMRTGDPKDPTKILTNFHLELVRILEKYNYEERRWERWFDVYIEYYYKKRHIKSPIITLSPRQAGVPVEFANAIWDVDFRTCYISSAITLKSFVTYLYREQRPKEVRVYDHFGFIKIDSKQYYLTSNALVELRSDPHEPMLFHARGEDGTFPIGDDRYIMLDPNLDVVPWLDGIGPEEDGLYKKADSSLYLDKGFFAGAFKDIQDNLSQMISGKDPLHLPEGQLVLGYVYSYLLFDEIFLTFNHVVYLYLYGPGNSGKGSLCEIILSFFGLPFYPHPNPTVSALETLLGIHSKVPLWIDEFVPEETPGKKHTIKDQYWNSYFQLTHRPVSSRDSRYKTAAPKPVRANVLFASNYIPRSDHFSSRLIRMEYKVEKRGGERHYRELQNSRDTLQRLFFSAMYFRRSYNNRYLRAELLYVKDRLYRAARAELEKPENNNPWTLHDRQAEQYACMWLGYQLFKNPRFGDNDPLEERGYYARMDVYYSEKENTDPERCRKLLDVEDTLFTYCVQQLVRNAQAEAERDSFTDFLDVVGDLVRSPDNPNHIKVEKHFHWSDGGDLYMYWSAVWNRFAKQVGQAEAVMIKTYVSKKMDELDIKGKRHTVNWSSQDMMEAVRVKGYKIVDAAGNEQLKDRKSVV